VNLAVKKLTIMSQMPVNNGSQLLDDQVGDLILDWFFDKDLSPEALLELGPKVDVVTGIGHGDMKPWGLHRFPNLKALLITSTGYESVTPDMIPDGCLVTNTYEHEKPIADWVIMAMLMLSREAIKTDRTFRDKSISILGTGIPKYLDMAEATLGVIGLGRIAKRVVEVANAHGVRCVAAMRTPISDDEASEAGLDAVFGMNQLDEMLGMCDFVLPTVPLNDSTIGLIGADEYAAMKDGSYIINVARGEVLDEQATYEALVSGKLAGAAFDVWWRDDIPGLATDDPERRRWAEYPFWELANVLMSPHFSGFTSLMVPRKTGFIASQLVRLAEGKPLENVIPELSKASND
jgi:phosphoglycerate dehydrogenase-like enzyme